jgi:hypothetical protein
MVTSTILADAPKLDAELRYGLMPENLFFLWELIEMAFISCLTNLGSKRR